MPTKKGSLHRHKWTPASRYRAGDKDPAALAAHAAETTQWRHDNHPVTGETADMLLTLLAAGHALRITCDRLGVTTQAVHGRAQWDPEWSTALDAALMAGRDPDLPHGTHKAYRQHCRCPECRDFHHGTA